MIAFLSFVSDCILLYKQGVYSTDSQKDMASDDEDLLVALHTVLLAGELLCLFPSCFVL